MIKISYKNTCGGKTVKGKIVAGIASLAISVILGLLFIPLLKKIKAGQTILHYVKEHEKKNGTPTMGGLFFILPSSLIFLLFGGAKSRIALVSMSIGLAFLVVGFLDDYIKIHRKKNEGLKPYQKIIFQLSIAVLAGVYAWHNGLTTFYIPFISSEIDLGFSSIIVIAVIFIAITNSVNLTDGLDGLAASVSVVYLFFLSVLILLQCEKLSFLRLGIEEYQNLNLLSACLIGGTLGFLIFNVSPAKVFMGDTGSLSLGGFIGAISIFSLNSFFIPVLGIMFVVSSISVIVQVLYYKKTKTRVFLMAPIHHHYQLKGYSETKIVFAYVLISVVFGLLSVIPYL